MKKQTGVISFLTILCFLLVTGLPCQAADNEIYACKNNKTGTPRFVSSPNKCKTKTEHLVILNGTDQQVPDNAVPIVGHWSFMQLTVDHPDNPAAAYAPKMSVGDLEIKADGTFIGWNVVKSANNPIRFTEDYSSTWVRVSKYHYITGDGYYDVILSPDGQTAMFALSRTKGVDVNGHFEYGHMFKNVVINHSELQ